MEQGRCQGRFWQRECVKLYSTYISHRVDCGGCSRQSVSVHHQMICMPATRDLPGFPNPYVTKQGIGWWGQAFNGAVASGDARRDETRCDEMGRDATRAAATGRGWGEKAPSEGGRGGELGAVAHSRCGVRRRCLPERSWVMSCAFVLLAVCWRQQITAGGRCRVVDSSRPCLVPMLSAQAGGQGLPGGANEQAGLRRPPAAQSLASGVFVCVWCFDCAAPSRQRAGCKWSGCG